MASNETPSTAAEVDEDSDSIKTAERSVARAEKAYKIAKDDPNIPESMVLLLAKLLEDTQATLARTMSRRRDASSDVKTVVPAMPCILLSSSKIVVPAMKTCLLYTSPSPRDRG